MEESSQVPPAAPHLAGWCRSGSCRESTLELPWQQKALGVFLADPGGFPLNRN